MFFIIVMFIFSGCCPAVWQGWDQIKIYFRLLIKFPDARPTLIKPKILNLLNVVVKRVWLSVSLL
jgi:hypothetical protein